MADFLIMDDDKKTWGMDSLMSSTKKDKSFSDKIKEFFDSLQKIKVKEKAVFYRLMSTMTNAWISIVKSVATLEEQEKNPAFKKVLNLFWKELKEWKNLSETMSMFPNIFDESEIWMIKSWEKTGKLNTTLRDLAYQVEKISSITWKLKSAMIYPAFILLVVFWVIFVLMTMVVPKLLEIFWDKSTLPDSTKTLILISDIFSNYWYLIIWFFALSFVVINVWKRTPDGRYNFDSIMLKLPIFWEITKKIVLSKFSRVFSWLVSSWVSVVESLRITAHASWNEVYKQRILLLAEDVSWGIKINESLDSDALFPNMMVQMIKVWEDTAQLDQTITKVADFYDEQVDNTISIINKLLEPFIIVTLAVIVWLIAMWVMEPIMALTDSVSK